MPNAVVFARQTGSGTAGLCITAAPAAVQPRLRGCVVHRGVAETSNRQSSRTGIAAWWLYPLPFEALASAMAKPRRPSAGGSRSCWSVAAPRANGCRTPCGARRRSAPPWRPPSPRQHRPAPRAGYSQLAAPRPRRQERRPSGSAAAPGRSARAGRRTPSSPRGRSCRSCRSSRRGPSSGELRGPAGGTAGTPRTAGPRSAGSAPSRGRSARRAVPLRSDRLQGVSRMSRSRRPSTMASRRIDIGVREDRRPESAVVKARGHRDDQPLSWPQSAHRTAFHWW